jgi:hypothetical protein
MPTTIAYSNKGGYWKTKYTWFASFMEKVGRKFFTSSIDGASTSSEYPSSLVWKHNVDDDTKRTNYYNQVGGSGGILYGHIGLSNTLIDGSNIKVLGTFEFGPYSPQGTAPGEANIGGIQIPQDQHNISRPVSSVKDKSKYFFTLTDEANGQLIGAYSIDGNSIDLSSSSSWSDEAFGQPFNLGFTGGDYFNSLIFRSIGGEEFDFDLSDLYDGAQQDFNYGLATLYEITPQEINGAPPRGQYAQADIVLGSQPYELYAINVNYEPTDLDHSK